MTSSAPGRADPLLTSLNERQLQAVTMPDTSAIILAGAGSGKTSVLTKRIAWLLREGRASRESLLAVTFTNKAAKEMKTRLAKLIGRSTDGMWIGTFHGLCHRMLRENPGEAGLPPGFTIMDDDDQLAMIKRLIKEHGEPPAAITPQTVKDYINKMKERGLRAGRVGISGAFDAYASEFYKMYEARCLREGVVDFSELMLRVTELFQTSQAFLDRYRGRFSHILVDEFQDTNQTQYEWLKCLRADHTCMFAVGDDDQSIYAFRGSKPENMAHFVREIANGQIVRLEQNYRSTGIILAAANALIENNSGRMGKSLWTSAGEGLPVDIIEFENDLDEANFIAQQLKKMIAAGRSPDEIALLYRSNYQSRSYEKALVANGVPYVIYGGTRFFERMEIKNALAYLRLLVNLNDDGAFRRAISFPSRGVGETTLDDIASVAKTVEAARLAENPANAPPVGMLEAASDYYAGRAREKVLGFVRVMQQLMMGLAEMPLGPYLDFLINTTGLIELYSKKDEDKEKDRVDNLKELVSAAYRFCEESDTPGATRRPAAEMVNEFLASASLEAGSDTGHNEDQAIVYNPKAVTLMTVHAAKGLEFDTVFVVGTEDSVFPPQRALDEGNEEEERRLMYVAITRAKRRLVITLCSERYIRGERRALDRSRFVNELPEHLVTQRKVASTRGTGGKGGPAKAGAGARRYGSR